MGWDIKFTPKIYDYRPSRIHHHFVDLGVKEPQHFTEISDEEFYQRCQQSSNLIYKLDKNFSNFFKAIDRTAKYFYTRDNEGEMPLYRYVGDFRFEMESCALGLFSLWGIHFKDLTDAKYYAVITMEQGYSLEKDTKSLQNKITFTLNKLETAALVGEKAAPKLRSDLFYRIEAYMHKWLTMYSRLIVLYQIFTRELTTIRFLEGKKKKEKEKANNRDNDSQGDGDGG